MKDLTKAVGKQVTVQYDVCTGEALLLESASIDGQWRVFDFADRTVEVVDAEQVIEIGRLIRPRK